MKNIRIYILLLAMSLLFVMAACTNSSDTSSASPSATPPESSSPVSSEESITPPADSSISGTDEGEAPQSGGTENTAVAALEEQLVMPDATNVVPAEGAIVYNTDSSLDDVKAFFLEAVDNLNGQGGAVDLSTEELTSWSWVGTYEEKSLTISANTNPVGEGLLITIAYE